MKIAVVQKGIEDEDLRRHTLMHAARLSTYPFVREEIRSIVMARDTLAGPAPMDVSAVYQGKGKGKGRKGKGKGKGKDKDKNKEKDPAANPDAEMICYYCHRKRSPQTRLQDIRERQRQEGCQRSGTSAWVDTRGRCGAFGVSMIELDDWILTVSFDDHEEMVGSIERVTVDSGAAFSVCPLGYVPEVPMSNYLRRATLRTASGTQIEHAGQKMVEYENGDGG